MSLAASELRYGLPESAIQKILGILSQYPEIEHVWLFGSRAKGNFRTGSDIDLCLEAPKLTLCKRLEIENRLDDLLLPWSIDLLPKHEIDNPALLEHIRRVGVVFAVQATMPVDR